MHAQQQDEWEPTSYAMEPAEPWILKALKPKHFQIAALLAQGARNVDIARIVGVTPEYVSMLTKQPLVRAHIMKISEAAGIRLEALTEASVEAIADTLKNGSEAGKMKAARLQLEATKRLGRGEGPTHAGSDVDEHLLRLADRITNLFSRAKQGNVYENGSPAEDAVILGTTQRLGSSQAREETKDSEE